jgi:heparan-alpha-glucosaminide N-acetyltransferase
MITGHLPADGRVPPGGRRDELRSRVEAAAGPRYHLPARAAVQSRAIDASARTARLVSVDAYRGFVMLLMLAEVLRSCDVAAALGDSRFWTVVCQQQTHVAWTGSTLHDLIQPSFYFLVGLALLLSATRRRLLGVSVTDMSRHVMTRSLLLVALGIVIVSVDRWRWSWWFGDTLTQIGLAYPFVFLVMRRPRRDWYLMGAAILFAYWLLFALFPLPPAAFDYASVNVSADWLKLHGLTGFAAHWQKNSNPAWAFDYWFLNIFHAGPPYVGNPLGLTTLNFVPSIATMILGLIAGDVLYSGRSNAGKVTWLSTAGISMICCGWLLGWLGICPVVKSIWTPSWVLFSGGWCFLILAAFQALGGITAFNRAALPLTVIGTNSLVAYSVAHLYPALAFGSLRHALGPDIFMRLGNAYEPAMYGLAVLGMYWFVLFLLNRARIFVRI